MNLFVAGWGLSPQRVAAVVAELRRTATLFPLLDPTTFWATEPGDGIVAASVRTADPVAEPRQYLHVHDGGVVLFDGLPIDPTGSLAAHRANELESAWDRLPSILEGRFSVVRIQRQPLSIELLTDPLGVGQLFVHEAGGSSLISNSAGLIERLVGASGLDPLGVSTFLALDYVGSDRTLRSDVRVIPAAQRWSWTPGQSAWTRSQYWSLIDQAAKPNRPVDPALIAEVTADLTRFSAAAARVHGFVNAPLTGGRDSRMLAAVLVGAGIPTRYWTKGDAGSQDVEIGGAIAARYGLQHRIANRPTQLGDEHEPTREIAAAWDRLGRQFVAQTDGLASLINLGNILGQPARVDRIAVSMTALSGESARQPHGTPYLYEPDSSVARVRALLPSMVLAAPRGLIRKEAYRLATGELMRVIDSAAEKGVPYTQISNVNYLEGRCRRWASMNPRELAQTEDKVLPFLTRSYVSAALSIRSEDRWLDVLHRGIMRTSVPGMESDPPFDIAWAETIPWSTRSERIRRQAGVRIPHDIRAALIRLRELVRPPATPRAATTPYDEPAWVEANLDSVRDVCLSDPTSDLWAFVDRRVLERLLASRTSSAERRLSQLPLFATITIRTYEQIAAGLAAVAVGGVDQSGVLGPS